MRTLSTLCEPQHQEVSTVPLLSQRYSKESHRGVQWAHSSFHSANKNVRSLVEFVLDFIRSLCQRSYRDGGNLGVGLAGCGIAGGGRGVVGIGIERAPVLDVCTPTADVLLANL